MNSNGRLVTFVMRGLAVISLLAVACTGSARPGAPGAQATEPQGSAARGAPAQVAATTAAEESIDELYQKALREGGTLVLWGTILDDNAAILLPIFEQRFPGIKVDYVHMSGDKLVARAISELRGSGKVHGDAFQSNLDYLHQLHSQKVFADTTVPEASAFPPELQGSYWVATEQLYSIVTWNTNLVRPEEAPRGFEDVADPRWRGKVMADAREVELLVGLTRKYGSQARAEELLRKVAANEPEFYKGHSELAALLTAGQNAIVFGTHSTQPVAQRKRGAPVDYALNEGIGKTSGVAIMKDAPHPNTARLWFRWITSEEGQQAIAESGRGPAHPNVPPIEKLRPAQVYSITEADLREFPRYERTFKEIFGIR